MCEHGCVLCVCPCVLAGMCVCVRVRTHMHVYMRACVYIDQCYSCNLMATGITRGTGGVG